MVLKINKIAEDSIKIKNSYEYTILKKQNLKFQYSYFQEKSIEPQLSYISYYIWKIINVQFWTLKLKIVFKNKIRFSFWS